jgi:hypothetical protein
METTPRREAVDLPTLLTSLASSAVFGAVVATLVSHFLGARLETIRRENSAQIEELKVTHLERLERLRTELRSDAYQTEVRFARLHEKRVEVVSELYRRLVIADMLLGYLEQCATLGFEIDEALRGKADQAMMNFWEFSLSNRVWFDQAVCGLLDRYRANQALTRVYAGTFPMEPSDSSLIDPHELARLKAENKELIGELQERMRDLLAVVSPAEVVPAAPSAQKQSSMLGREAPISASGS